MASEDRHITRMLKTEALFRTNGDQGQSAILTDQNEEWVYYNSGKTKLYYTANQKYWDGAWSYCNADFGQVTLHDDLLVDEYIKRAAGGDDRIRFENDKITLEAGGNVVAIFEDDAITFSKVFGAVTGSTIGNLTLANGSITDSGGAISFGDENLTTTGIMGIGSGAVGAPGWYFAADTDTGAYYTATQINWAVAGVQEMKLSGSGLWAGAIGIGLYDPIETVMIYGYKWYTGTSNNLGMYVLNRWTPSGHSPTRYMIGLEYTNWLGGNTNIKEITGLRIRNRITGGGAIVADGIGLLVELQAENPITKTCVDYFCIKSIVTTSATKLTTTGDAYQLCLEDYLGAITVGATAYGIKQEGDLINNFDGVVQIASDTNGLVLGAGQDILLYSNAPGVLFLKPGAADTDTVLNFFGTTNSGVVSWMEDEDYFKFGDTVVIDTGDLFFTGDGSGLLFAEIYIVDNAVAQTIPTGAVYTKLTGAATNGQSNGCTADGVNAKITTITAGRYKIDAHFNGSVDTANTEFQGAIFVDGVIQNNLRCAVEFVAANKACSSSLTGIIDVAAAKDIDFRVIHDDGGDVDLTIEHANINVTMIGGT